MDSEPVKFSPSLLVASLNQTLEAVYNRVMVLGEISGFRISKNRWVYFDIKDDAASLKCFATVYQLPGPLEDGMLVEVVGTPRLHPQFGFSINLSAIKPAGEGSIARQAQLLRAKLEVEGLFAEERKRPISYAPSRIGLITSIGSAAYGDFIKVLNERWGGVTVEVTDSLVQGINAPAQIIKCLEYFNQAPEPPEVVVITRGGGSADDLAAFNDERLVRAVAASRVPTLIAIGHERDLSLAELAADKRASTPTAAVAALVPDKHYELARLAELASDAAQKIAANLDYANQELKLAAGKLSADFTAGLAAARALLDNQKQLVEALNPRAILARGYALVRQNRAAVRSIAAVRLGSLLQLELADGIINSKVTEVSAHQK